MPVRIPPNVCQFLYLNQTDNWKTCVTYDNKEENK